MSYNMQGWKPVKAYNGKSGCMCGCLGNYNEDPSSKAFKARLRKVEAFVGPMRPDSNDRNAYSSKPFCGDRYVAVECGGRVTAVYFEQDFSK